MKRQDKLRVLTIRALIGAIDNAGSVEVVDDRYEPKIGLGHDVDRRHVTDDEERRILIAERDDLAAAARQYSELYEAERAEEMTARAGIVSEYLV